MRDQASASSPVRSQHLDCHEAAPRQSVVSTLQAHRTANGTIKQGTASSTWRALLTVVFVLTSLMVVGCPASTTQDDSDTLDLSADGDEDTSTTLLDGVDDTGDEDIPNPCLECDAESCCTVDGVPTCVDLTGNSTHCGGCGLACTNEEICVEGQCLCDGVLCGDEETCCSEACVLPGHPSCPCGDLTDGCDAENDEWCCDGLCAPLTADASNCGECGIECADYQICANGACVCPPAAPSLCDGACVNTLDDVDNCGACGTTCEGDSPACCNGVCVDLDNDSAHCSACSLECGNGESCCDASCIDVNAEDNANCGACGVSCEAGESCCGGSCADLTEDVDNCGHCGTTCTAARVDEASCAAGVCGIVTCKTGWADCDDKTTTGCETNIYDSATTCGDCNTNCNEHLNVSSAACDTGVCAYTCWGTSMDCDATPGCESSKNNTETCGSCGNNCTEHSNITSGTCAGGKCAYECEELWLDCSGGTEGCESPVDSIKSCGSCDNDCTALEHVNQEACADGVCTYKCANNWYDCDAEPGCEIPMGPDHCGECSVPCLAPATCVDGVCTP